MKPFTDSNNFESFKNGCTSAFTNIYTKHGRQIFFIGKDLVNDSFIVETLVQDTFLKLWTNRDRIESPRHIFFFLRFVIKRECISYFTRPKNKFFRKVHSLDCYNNYQDYMTDYDPICDIESLELQGKQQKDFDKIKQVLPLLNADRRHLINLCLKYGFHYKAISTVMGKSINETSREVRMAVNDIKTIIDQGHILKTNKRNVDEIRIGGNMTDKQARILKLRCAKKCSFVAIARMLNLSQKEVQREFMTAYRVLQDQRQSA